MTLPAAEFDDDAAVPTPQLRVLPAPPDTGPGDAPEPPEAPEVGEAPETPGAGDEHALELWCQRLVLAVSEVVRGRRAITQLVPWTDHAVYCSVHRQLRRLRLAFPPTADHLAVRSIHTSRVGPACAEVTARLEHDGRSRALALRLERQHGRWICTALELV